jgi:hypothetical protein
MIPGHIEGADVLLGAPANWDKATQGPCGRLPVRIERTEGVPVLWSVWHPTPKEIAAIVAGAPVKLWVVGERHPPVMLGIGNVLES